MTRIHLRGISKRFSDKVRPYRKANRVVCELWENFGWLKNNPIDRVYSAIHWRLPW